MHGEDPTVATSKGTGGLERSENLARLRPGELVAADQRVDEVRFAGAERARRADLVNERLHQRLEAPRRRRARHQADWPWSSGRTPSTQEPAAAVRLK